LAWNQLQQWLLALRCSEKDRGQDFVGKGKLVVTMRRNWTSLSLFFVARCCLVHSAPALGQYNPGEQHRDYDRDRGRDEDLMYGPGWQVMKATWGSGNRWMDVTYQVRMLFSGNGMVKVNNQNMGGDPAVGADKTLHIEARNFEGQQKHFRFEEGSSIDASQFYNYRGTAGEGSEPGWRLMWAEWGSENRWMDVTDRMRTLLVGSGMIKVSNQNMGGDPAVGAEKVLRISARDARGRTRHFSYKEGSSFDASEFYSYSGGGYYPPNDAGFGLRIVRAYYGLNGRNNDVTEQLRSMVQGNSLVVQVNNNNMGGDPAVGADKVLTVIYRINDREQTATVKEGNQLRIP
jgi:hypothetical protein